MLTVLTGSTAGVTPGRHGWGVRSGGQGREGSGGAPEGSGGGEARRASGWGSRLEKLLGGLRVKVRQAGLPFRSWGPLCPQVLSRPRGQAPGKAAAHCRLGACCSGEATSPWACRVTRGTTTRPAKGARGTRRPVPAGRHVAAGMKGAIQEG